MAEHKASCPSVFGGACDCDFALHEAMGKLLEANDLLMKCCPRCEEFEAAIRSALDDLSRRSGIDEAVETLTRVLKP